MDRGFFTIAVITVCALIGNVKTNSISNPSNNCNINVWPRSVRYFKSRLIGFKPNFVRFRLEINSISQWKNTSNVFMPLNWVWTFKSPDANYPFLSWNIDYGLLSFGLLDFKTLDIEYVKINISENCNITFGDIQTTDKIVKALTDAVNISEDSYFTYETSYFCYLAVDESVENSISYYVALYLNYPITYINYMCCQVKFSYTNERFIRECSSKPHPKWEQSLSGPYIIGLIIFMYCPIVLFQVSAWLIKDDIECEQIRTNRNSVNGDDYQEIPHSDDDWLYLDGNPPISVGHFLQFIVCNLGKKHPVLMSRIRRIIFIILTPSFIYIQLVMYRNGIGTGDQSKIYVKDLAKIGVPMGFLALLGDKEDQYKVFAPLLGGPRCLLIMFLVLSVVLFILPRSLNQVVERGMPVKNAPSPLCLDVEEIMRFSMYRTSPAPGYEKGHVICKSSIYMLLNKLFWIRVFKIQSQRISICFNKSGLITILSFVLLPIYLVFCLLEIFICISFYGVPLFGFVTILVKGAVKSLLEIRRMRFIFRNPLIILIGTCTALILFLFYVYSVGLIFIQSFFFICQVLIFCFIAVILYPSVAFGYLFFCVIMLYYLVRLMKDFGGEYVELLSIAVEKSQELFMHSNNVSFVDGQLVLSNIRVEAIRGIRINDVPLDVANNSLQRVQSQNETQKIREINNVYGIPRSLFDFLVLKHKPIHIQVLKLFLHLGAVILLVASALEITSKFATGATSEISEVMHVLFIVTVGALPRVLEMVWMKSNETVMRDIETRCIERDIMEYWRQKAEDNVDTFVFID